jgi:membrane protease YdiL (CAAX protease family)
MPGRGKRAIRIEILLVLGVSLGQSALFSIVDFIGKLTAGKPLSAQATTLNPSQAAGRPWLDLSFQLLQILFGIMPAFLALHLLRRDKDDDRKTIGLEFRRLGRDLGAGAGLAALIGIPGLAFYFVSRAAGFNTNVIPEALPAVWWTIPVLVLAAVQNAVLEEVVVVGYLTTRLRDLAWSAPLIVAASALLRGSYHLYQGVGGFAGNAIMGLFLALVFLRFRRILPLIVAHALLDIFAFVGYALLKGHVPFLPGN